MSAKTGKEVYETEMPIAAKRFPWEGVPDVLKAAWEGVAERRANRGPGPLPYTRQDCYVMHAGMSVAKAKNPALAAVIMNALNEYQGRER